MKKQRKGKKKKKKIHLEKKNLNFRKKKGGGRKEGGDWCICLPTISIRFTGIFLLLNGTKEVWVLNRREGRKAGKKNAYQRTRNTRIQILQGPSWSGRI